MRKRKNPVFDSFLRAITSTLAMLLCAALSVGGARAQAPAPDRIVGMEVGVGAGRSTLVPPESNAEFGKATLTRPGDWSASGSLGRTERFGDKSVDFGGSFTKTLPPGVDATVGLSSGTGEFIASRYRFDASLRTALLLPDRSLVAGAGFRRIQSKAQNYSNGMGVDLAWYAASHWLLGAGVLTDWGYPGNTKSTSYSASATLYEYKRWYIGGTVRQGHVAYTAIGPSLTLVDYPSRSWTATGTWWPSDRDALSVDLDYLDNSFYTGRNLTLRWYREFR